MVPDYSDIEGTLVSDTMVFYGTVWKSECFYWSFRLCRFKQSPATQMQSLHSDPDTIFRSGDGRMI